MNLPYIISNTSVTAIVNGQSLTAASDHVNFQKIKETLASDSFDNDALVALFDIGISVQLYAGGKVEVSHGSVKYKGEHINNYVTDKIVQFMGESLPVEPIVNFLDRLLANPSRRATEELYKFLEHKNMPLTPDGCFLAYKGVRSDYMDKHTGKFSNAVGAVLEMTRRNVCDDANVGCSNGFHAGSLSYANDWAGADGKLMIVKIDPADVVSVPLDSNCQKLRTSKYVVVGEQTDRQPLTDTYTSDYDEDDGEMEAEGESDYDDVAERGYDNGYVAGETGSEYDEVDPGNILSRYSVEYVEQYRLGFAQGVVDRNNSL